MTQDAQDRLRREAAAALHVDPAFDAKRQIERRIAFLADCLARTGRKCLVLGISGGVDSLLAGCLAQRAAQRARARGLEASLIAMRLPYGIQRDQAAAEQALSFIHPDRSMTVDIQPACDAMLAGLEAAGLSFRDPAHRDFTAGNIKARQRMIAQYAVAGAHDGLVVGTDQAAEALMGFFTKFGDGAADVVPLAGLTKRQVRAMARSLGAPDELVEKVPTADLESLAPLRPDEAALGVSYRQIDDFLEGRRVDDAAFAVIERTYRQTAHKRALPVAPD